MRRLRILVVDDEKGTRDLLARMFRYRGHEVSLADSAGAALRELCDGSRYDVVVADLVMRGEDGEEMIRKMRLIDPNIALVVVSGKLLSSEERERLGGMGVRHHPKPYRNHEVLRTIEQIAGREEISKAEA